MPETTATRIESRSPAGGKLLGSVTAATPRDVAVAVDRAALQRVLGELQRDAALVLGTGRRAGQLQRGECRPCVAACSGRQERDRLVVDLGRSALAALQGAAQQRFDVGARQLVEFVDLGA